MNGMKIAIAIAVVALLGIGLLLFTDIISQILAVTIWFGLFLIGVWIGLLLIPFAFIVVSIAFIKKLSDNPSNRTKPYFFTAVEPGRIKAVVRGGRVIRYLMNYPGHGFKGEKKNIDESEHKSEEKKKEDAHWEVTELADDDNPIPLVKREKFNGLKFIVWPLYFRQVFGWCISVIYRWTKHVFVGIWPWQTLHFYTFSRKVQVIDSEGKVKKKEDGTPLLEETRESTDHVRARTFVWNVEGQAGETREGLKVQVRGIANVKTINPQKALFGTDRWDVVLTSTILRTLAEIIRTMPINEVVVVSTNPEVGKDKLSKAIVDEANKRLIDKYGIEIDDYQIIDFEAKLSPEDQNAFTAKWRAEKLKEAEKIQGRGRGDGRAAEITAVANAIKKGGDEAKRAQELEALIRQASEAGKSGGVVIIGGQGAESGINAAMLAELKKLNKGE